MLRTAVSRAGLRAGVQSSVGKVPGPALQGSLRYALVVRAAASSSGAGASSSWQIRMLYDGDCPLCMKEVDFLKSKDSGKGAIDFVDIASPSYRAEDNQGITFQQAMEKIHAITSDGRVITNIEVFRRLYEAVGLGWVYAITANPTIEKLANMVYGFWAKYRMEVTGREALGVILERRAKSAQAAAVGGDLPTSMCGDEDSVCEIPLPPPRKQQPQQQTSAR